jgi:anthranilate phosphoribosyltransferase
MSVPLGPNWERARFSICSGPSPIPPASSGKWSAYFRNTLTGPTVVAALENGNIRSFEVTPEEAGLARIGGDALKGGDADANAVALRSVLDGMPSPFRDVALLNAAAALIVAGRAKNLKEGVALGAQSLDSGAAAARLKNLIAVSNS